MNIKRIDAEVWREVGEITVLALAFLAPLAVSAKTYDPSALRAALVQSVALTLALALVLKGLLRGRWDMPSSAWITSAPLAVLAIWTLGRFAVATNRQELVPTLCLAAAGWMVFVAARSEMGGARHAARLSFWTAAAASIVGAAALLQKVCGLRILPLLTDRTDQLSAWATAALGMVLATRLDPESTKIGRLQAACAAVLLGLIVGWSGSGRAGAAHVVGALVFSAVVGACLKTRESYSAAGLALLSAAVAALGARPRFPAALAFGVDAIVFVVAAATIVFVGIRSSRLLRRSGALAEAAYGAAFTSAFAAWAVSSALGLLPAVGIGAVAAWMCGGVAAGLHALNRPRSVVRALPIAAGQDVRRLMQGPVILLFTGLVAGPGGWLYSDVAFNRAVASLREGKPEPALADAASVWRGSAVYAPSLVLRGRASLDLGRPRDAVEYYARVEKISPEYPRLHAAIADAYVALGDLSSAARERMLQVQAEPGRLPDVLAWCRASRITGDLDSAQKAGALALALSPDDPDVRGELAENALLAKRRSRQDDAQRRNGRKGLALKHPAH